MMGIELGGPICRTPKARMKDHRPERRIFKPGRWSINRLAGAVARLAFSGHGHFFFDNFKQSDLYKT
jgi:hypothetical protein